MRSLSLMVQVVEAAVASPVLPPHLRPLLLLQQPRHQRAPNSLAALAPSTATAHLPAAVPRPVSAMRSLSLMVQVVEGAVASPVPPPPHLRLLPLPPLLPLQLPPPLPALSSSVGLAPLTATAHLPAAARRPVSAMRLLSLMVQEVEDAVASPVPPPHLPPLLLPPLLLPLLRQPPPQRAPNSSAAPAPSTATAPPAAAAPRPVFAMRSLSLRAREVEGAEASLPEWERRLMSGGGR